jgi:hypothetical protein
MTQVSELIQQVADALGTSGQVLVDALSTVGDPGDRNLEPLITGLSLQQGRAGQGPDPIRLPKDY